MDPQVKIFITVKKGQVGCARRRETYRVAGVAVQYRAGTTPGIGIPGGIGLREEVIGVRGVALAKFVKSRF